MQLSTQWGKGRESSSVQEMYIAVLCMALEL